MPRYKHEKTEDDFFSDKDPDLQNRIKQYSLLLYHVKKDVVINFIKDPANNLLIEYFTYQNGLASTDLNDQKPICRFDVLESFLQTGHYLK